MHCRIHVRYAAGVEALEVVRRVLDLWDGSRRAPLCHVPLSGPPMPASEESVWEELEEGAGVTLRHRRRNKDTDTVRLQFGESGPEGEPGDAGSCHVCFYHERVDRAEAGYAPDDLVEIIAALVEAGPAVEAFCFGGDPFGASDFRELARRAKQADAGAGALRSLWWLTFVPQRRLAATVAELKRLSIEHTVPRTIHNRGAILSLAPAYPGDSAGFHEILRRVRQLPPEDRARCLAQDLETIPVFRLAGKDLEIQPFRFGDSPSPGANAKYSEMATAFVASIPGKALDFSRASLSALAAHLVSAPDLEAVLPAAAAYFGEVLRRNAAAPFQWVDYDDWSRANPALTARIRGPKRRLGVLVSQAGGVVRPGDRICEGAATPR